MKRVQLRPRGIAALGEIQTSARHCSIPMPVLPVLRLSPLSRCGLHPASTSPSISHSITVCSCPCLLARPRIHDEIANRRSAPGPPQPLWEENFHRLESGPSAVEICDRFAEAGGLKRSDRPQRSLSTQINRSPKRIFPGAENMTCRIQDNVVTYA